MKLNFYAGVLLLLGGWLMMLTGGVKAGCTVYNTTYIQNQSLCDAGDYCVNSGAGGTAYGHTIINGWNCWNDDDNPDTPCINACEVQFYSGCDSPCVHGGSGPPPTCGSIAGQCSGTCPAGSYCRAKVTSAKEVVRLKRAV